MWFAGLEVHVKYDKKEALQGSLFHSSLHCPGDKKEPANLEKKKAPPVQVGLLLRLGY